MRIETLRQRLREHGARPLHEQRVLRLWAQALPQDHGRRKPEDFLPEAVRSMLPAFTAELAGLARLNSTAAPKGAPSPSRRPPRASVLALQRRWDHWHRSSSFSPR